MKNTIMQRIDFTVGTYRKLLLTLKDINASFLTFEESLKSQLSKYVILRHDVDLLPENSLLFARIEAEMGIRGSYYFRIVPESFDEKIIEEIHSLGHEIGYHYEELSAAGKRGHRAQGRGHGAGGSEEEIVKVAIERFKYNLEKIREIVPVKTICMHGSPLSRLDSRLLWKYYDYNDFGLVGEPYFDIDFNEVLYLTDTGRRWDGEKVSIRDKGIGIRNKGLGISEKGIGIREKGFGEEAYDEWKVKPKTGNNSPHSALRHLPALHSSFDIIRAAENGLLQDRIMMNSHPQRWTDDLIPWMKELVWQNVKNGVKFYIVGIRD